jgi:hypothetical protein
MKQQLMLVAMLSVGTALTTMGRIKPVAASLTPPVSYDYSYTWNATDSEQYLNVNGVDSIPLYTRTANGIYFNYTSTFNVIDGLDVTQTFNRSNTAWQSSGTYYKPDENKIGSDSNVGSTSLKWYVKFDNQTNKDHKIFLDFSSTANTTRVYHFYINGQVFINNIDNNRFYYVDPNKLLQIWLPSFSYVEFYTENNANNLNYFDAWYLQSLGISESYQQGLGAETQGILTDYLGTDAQQIGWVLIGIAAILFAFKGGK